MIDDEPEVIAVSARVVRFRKPQQSELLALAAEREAKKKKHAIIVRKCRKAQDRCHRNTRDVDFYG